MEITESERSFEHHVDLLDEDGLFAEFFAPWQEIKSPLPMIEQSTAAATPAETPEPTIASELPLSTLSREEVAKAIWYSAPNMVLFDQKTGLLPDRVDIILNKKGKWALTGDGSQAARNYLNIASINLDELVKGDSRVRKHTLAKGNALLTKDFATFWSQTIGKTGPLSLECAIEHYGAEAPEKIGKPHLTFWISDGFTRPDRQVAMLIDTALLRTLQ